MLLTVAYDVTILCDVIVGLCDVTVGICDVVGDAPYVGEFRFAVIFERWCVLKLFECFCDIFRDGEVDLAAVVVPI